MHLADDLVEVRVPAREEAGEEELDVAGGEEREVVGLLEAFAQEKEHGHHHQGDVVIPGLPAAGLVLVEPGLVLGVLAARSRWRCR